MKNFLKDLSGIGGQFPIPIEVKIISSPKLEPEKEESYDLKKEIRNLSGLFLSFKDQENYAILFNSPILLN